MNVFCITVIVIISFWYFTPPFNINIINVNKNVNTTATANTTQLPQKIITIAPAGLEGFYELGIVSYIKKHYDMTDYIYSGISAGAWNALFMSYKYSGTDFANKIVSNMEDKYNYSAYDIQLFMKKYILETYKEDDFELDKIYIGITGVCDTKIYHGFDNLTDVIDCCIASAHIPMMTGNHILHTYRDKYAFDGYFSLYPYFSMAEMEPIIHITPNMWENKDISLVDELLHTFVSLSHIHFRELYERGYKDAEENHPHYFSHLTKI